jgi:hypothetical protein
MLPTRFDDVEHLEDVMTTPSAALVATLRDLPGDILVLGVGGKMGPTLARLAKRAAPHKRVIGVARFPSPACRPRLQGQGVECIAADLLSRDAAGRAARRAQRGLHGRAQVRLQRQRMADLGDERPRASAGGRALTPRRASWPSPPPACTPSSTCRPRRAASRRR